MHVVDYFRWRLEQMHNLSVQLAKEKKYVCGREPKTVKSRRVQWVEEDMTMDTSDITNDCTEEDIRQDYST